MPPTAEQLLARMLDQGPRGNGAGAAFVRSDGFKRLRSSLRAGLGEGTKVEEVVDAAWLAARVRSGLTDFTQLLPPAAQQIQEMPAPTPLLSLVTTVPTSSPVIPVVPELIQSFYDGATADFANLPEIGGEQKWSREYLEAQRVGGIVTVDQQVFDDSAQAEGVIDRLLERAWARNVEAEILVGDGSTYVLPFDGVSATHLQGVVNTPGVPTIAVGALTEVDALASAVARVMAGGFYGPHMLAVSPATFFKIVTTKDTGTGSNNYLRWRSALPTVGALVPVAGLPAGDAVIGDPAEIVLFLAGGFGVEVSTDYTDVARGINYFTAGLAAAKGESRVAAWVRNPTAFCVVTGL